MAMNSEMLKRPLKEEDFRIIPIQICFKQCWKIEESEKQEREERKKEQEKQRKRNEVMSKLVQSLANRSLQQDKILFYTLENLPSSSSTSSSSSSSDKQ